MSFILLDVLTLLIPLVLIIGLIVIINKKLVFSTKYIKGKWIFGGYALILLISSVLFYMLPTDKIDFEKLNQEELKKVKNIYYDSDDILSLEQLEGLMMVKQWDFNYSEKQLKLADNFQESHFGHGIWVEKTDRTDNKIEVRYYSRAVFGDIDLTEKIKPPTIKIDDGILKLEENPEGIEINFSKIAKEFPIRQFTRESLFDTDNDMELEMIIIRVPKDIEIEGNYLYVG